MEEQKVEPNQLWIREGGLGDRYFIVTHVDNGQVFYNVYDTANKISEESDTLHGFLYLARTNKWRLEPELLPVIERGQRWIAHGSLIVVTDVSADYVATDRAPTNLQGEQIGPFMVSVASEKGSFQLACIQYGWELREKGVKPPSDNLCVAPVVGFNEQRRIAESFIGFVGWAKQQRESSPAFLREEFENVVNEEAENVPDGLTKDKWKGMILNHCMSSYEGGPTQDEEGNPVPTHPKAATAKRQITVLRKWHHNQWEEWASDRPLSI